MSNLQPHQQRVIQEKAELDEKLESLRQLFPTELFATLDSKERWMLIKQEHYMTCYSELLHQRIAAFPQPTQDPTQKVP